MCYCIIHRIFTRHRTNLENKIYDRIYTQLYIIEGESEGVNEEHEVLQMERTPRRHLQNTPINCLDIFKPLQGSKPDSEEENTRTVTAKGGRQNSGEELKGQKIRSVLTKGIAGIGKTVSVQKFILDWAEGKANQDVELMFVLPFRELNLIRDDPYSLHRLLCDFHPEIKDLGPKIYDQIKAVFIFDGLDESKIPLDFEGCEKVSDITITSSVGVLMTNLIKGELLPSALIWITSRPAAANQIPPKHINRVTEIEGFSDPQKEEYFRRRISDEHQAERIISHIKTVRTLHIMCHIPVFCWISATVLQQIMKQGNTEIPRTLTEMYSHFLLTQTHMKNKKYEEKDERDPKNLLESNRTILLKLAELAFTQLMKGNMMFYEEDLRESRIDVTDASVYSGIFTEIFREECVLYQRKVYCFVHLSFQEFLAAVYVTHCFLNKNINPLQVFKPQYSVWDQSLTLDELLIGATEKTLAYENGHLDLFLRFMLGISVESNQRRLQGLLKHSQRSSKKTTDHIKKLIKGDANYSHISPERSINLFLCLSEMKDQSLSKDLQEYLNSENHLKEKLSPGQCSALVCMLLMSEEVLDELDLKKYNTSEEGYKRLIPAITVSRKAFYVHAHYPNLCSALISGCNVLMSKFCFYRLAGCNLTTISCEILKSVLQSENSSLKDLDLSNNDLQDSGVEPLSFGLKSSLCKVEILRLSGCMVMDKGCSSLASALKSKPSVLKELDLTYNHPGESGVILLEDPLCGLDTFRVEHGGMIRIKPGLKKYSCELILDPNTANCELFVSEGNRKAKCVEEQSYSPHPDRFDFCRQHALMSLNKRPSSHSFKQAEKKHFLAKNFPYHTNGMICLSNNSVSKGGVVRILKLSDDTPAVGLIANGDKSANEKEVVQHQSPAAQHMKHLRNGSGLSPQPQHHISSYAVSIVKLLTFLCTISRDLNSVGRESSCISVTSEGSMQHPPFFSRGGEEPSCMSVTTEGSMVNPPVFSRKRRKPSCVSVTRGISVEKHPAFSSGVVHCDPEVLQRHRTSMKNKIYTQLYIIEGESEGVNEEHEVLQMERTPRRHLQDTPINCLDIFKPLQGSKPDPEEQNTRTVTAEGIAGIGKTVSVQKFILDWAEGKANQDVELMFVLPFRELNLIRDDPYSLHGLLCDFHPEIKDLDPKIHDQIKAVFIFDGLDESRIPLDFEECEKVSDITMTSSVAAANQIPPKHINRVTEIEGFSDPQKEEYFRRRISDEDQVERIISHIKTTHMKNKKYEEKDETVPKNLLESNRTSLLKLAELAFKQLMKGNVMFYEEDLRESSIDVTDASVYSGIFTEIFREECGLYQRKVYCFVHLSFQEFLAAVYVFHCYQIRNMKELQILNPQYREWSEDDLLDEVLRGAVYKAVQSQNGHLDLFLRFLLGISLESNQRLLQGLLTPTQSSSERTTEFIKRVIKGEDKKYPNIPSERSINLFLCLSEMNDQSLSREIQEFLQSEKHSGEELSPGQCSALAYIFLTSEDVLDELDLQKYNTSEEGYKRLIPAVAISKKSILTGCKLTEDSCKHLCSALQSANCCLKELDLSNNLQDTKLELLTIGLKSLHCKLETLRLSGCGFTTSSCKELASILQSAHSSLKKMDLSNNELQDLGVELLSAGLKSSHCKLEILRLHLCNIGENACESLGSALQTGNSLLKELDLQDNDLQDSGVGLLSNGLRHSHSLKKLGLSGCMVTVKGCSYLASALKSNPSHLEELDLTYNHPGESGVNLLSDLLEDPHCTLKKLWVDHEGDIRIKPRLRKYSCELTMNPNTAHRDLILSEDNRKVTRVTELQPHPDHPERFKRCTQVLCTKSLTGRCYWEAECSGYGAAIAVTYRGIGREGRSVDCWLGYNKPSWSLYCSGNSYSAWHNNKETAIPDPLSPSNRVGVYLDWGSGTLSFYTISPNSHKLTHLHTFTTTFTEPLYAGFWVSDESSVWICEK
ncbi:hypothetical protein NFI96_020965 [Prochilodus magdalenae]|nr:hypothetical protein NFI96_020965 [Prochilodus magdalenae]